MAVIQKPALAPHLLARYLPGEGLFLISERGSDVLVGETFGILLPLLNGRYSVDEILDRTAAQCGGAEVLYALDRLRTHGCLVDGQPGPGSPAGDWSAPGANADSAKVAILDHCSQGAAELTALLVAQGVQIDAAAALRVVLVDDYLDPVLATYNREWLAGGAPLMLLKPTGTILWLGPILVAGKTGCWECMADRLRRNRLVLRYLERRCGATLQLPAVSTAVTRSLAVSLAASEIVNWLRDGTSALLGALRTFDTASHALEQHVLTRRPQCSVCGAPAPAARPISLDEPPAALVSRDGGLRTRTATEVVSALGQHVSQILGVVPHLQQASTGDDDIHVFLSGQNLGATGGTLEVLTRTLRSRCSGKGLTAVQARASAVCESIERYATVFQGEEPHIVASVEDLLEEAIHPNACMLFSDTQYAERRTRNLGADGFNYIPQPLHPRKPLWWSPVWSLTEKRRRYCPTAYLYFHSEALQDPVGIYTCKPDSNGVATGSSYAEAVLQGLLELIERDAVALWWYPRTAVPRVDLESFGSDFLSHCVRYHKRIGRELWALDVTSDLGIPTFVGVSRRLAGEQQILMGFGAHLDARIAVQRAIAETNQLLTGVESLLHSSDADASATARWLRSATVEKESYLQGRRDLLGRAPRDCSAAESIAAALRQCLTAVQTAGLAVYALDLTRPDIDLKVVRVLCPGLRHFWARHAPGRLFEIPLALGRVKTRQRESDLNPIAMFL